MLRYLSPGFVQTLAKTASERSDFVSEREEGNRLHLTPAVAKEMAKQVGVIGLGTGLGAATAYLVGRLNDHYQLTKNVSSKRLLQASAAAATALPVLGALRNEVGMERLREAYERERQQKRESVSRTK